jgi:hypothetical protein
MTECLRSAFNDVAAHDVIWGYYRVEPVQRFTSVSVQGVLFRGLITLESIVKADSHSRRHSILQQGKVPRGGRLGIFSAFMYWFNGEARKLKRTPVSTIRDTKDYAFEVKPPVFEDSDEGPFMIWKRGTALHGRTGAVSHGHQGPLRRWGYVMWDRDRLEALGILEEQWKQAEDPLLLPGWPGLLPGGFDREWWKRSWMERTRIYRENGRGWWEMGDESKIVWANGNKGGRDSRDSGHS